MPPDEHVYHHIALAMMNEILAMMTLTSGETFALTLRSASVLNRTVAAEFLAEMRREAPFEIDVNITLNAIDAAVVALAQTIPPRKRMPQTSECYAATAAQHAAGECKEPGHDSATHRYSNASQDGVVQQCLNGCGTESRWGGSRPEYRSDTTGGAWVRERPRCCPPRCLDHSDGCGVSQSSSRCAVWCRARVPRSC